MNEVPKFMCEGSKGPHVILVQSFLCGVGCGGKFLLDGYQEEETVRAISIWQDGEAIKIDGNFGPESRKKAKERYGFDFESACQIVRGVTCFIQPNGEKILWSPQV